MARGREVGVMRLYIIKSRNLLSELMYISFLFFRSEDSTARMWSTKTNDTECIGVLKYVNSYQDYKQNDVFSKMIVFFSEDTAATLIAWLSLTVIKILNIF